MKIARRALEERSIWGLIAIVASQVVLLGDHLEHRDPLKIELRGEIMPAATALLPDCLQMHESPCQIVPFYLRIS